MLLNSAFIDHDSSIDLYSNISKQAMLNLGFIPSDLQPLTPDDIDVPPKFQQFKQEYILGKLQYAQCLRNKRLLMYQQQIKKIKDKENVSKSKNSLVLKRASRTANASRYNLHHLSNDQYTRAKSSRKSPLVSENQGYGCNRICNEYNKEQTQRINEVEAQFKIKKLSMSEKKRIYKKALEYNSGLLDSVYPGVKRNHQQQNKLLRPQINKLKKFSMKQNIKAQQAEQRRQQTDKAKRRFQLQFALNQNIQLHRLQQLYAKKKSEQEFRKKSKNERMNFVQLKQFEGDLIQRQTKQIFKNNLTFRQDNASQLKDQFYKARIRNKMTDYFKVDEVTRSKQVQQRKILKRNPFESLSFKSPSKRITNIKYKTRTQQSQDDCFENSKDCNISYNSPNNRLNSRKVWEHQKQVPMSSQCSKKQIQEEEEQEFDNLLSDLNVAEEFLERFRDCYELKWNRIQTEEDKRADDLQEGQQIDTEGHQKLNRVSIAEVQKICKIINRTMEKKQNQKRF